jgi:hypothetical protein
MQRGGAAVREIFPQQLCFCNLVAEIESLLQYAHRA